MERKQGRREIEGHKNTKRGNQRPERPFGGGGK